MKVLLFFIDGLGLGSEDAEVNPLARFGLSSMEKLFGNKLYAGCEAFVSLSRCLVPIDPTLGVPGLPQSATGQAAILTGLNAPKVMERHVQAFPGPELSRLINENNLMRKLTEAGMTATSANMYSPDYHELVANRKRRHSAITLAALSTGLPLRSLSDMAHGEAVYQDITNRLLPFFGIENVPILAPKKAAQNLLGIAAKADFTIFEYFQTDRFGHKHDWDKAKEILKTLDEFLEGILNEQPDDMLLLLTSDHGNFEDFSVKTHTYNKVPLIAIGLGAKDMIKDITDLTGIAPAILQFLGRDETHG